MKLNNSLIVLILIVFSTQIIALGGGVVYHSSEELKPGVFGQNYAGNWSFLNGSVGIGTTTPSATLEISKNLSSGAMLLLNQTSLSAGLVSQFNRGANSRQNTFQLLTGGIVDWVIGVPAGVGGGVQNNFAIAENLTGAIYGTNTYFTIQKGTGNIGIGTTNPGNKLTINGASSFSPGEKLIKLQTNSMQGGGNSAHSIAFGLSAFGTNNVLARIDLGTEDITADGNSYIAFRTNLGGGGGDLDVSSERMRITSLGNVGIGTTTPTRQLSIFGNPGAAIGQGININHTAGGGVTWGILTGGSGHTYKGGLGIFDEVNSVTGLYIQNGTGNVGIGTTSPSYPLHVVGNVVGGAVMRVQNNANGHGLYIVPGADTNQALIINNAADSISRALFYGDGKTILANGGGNVGIGRNPTTNKLEVEGDASKTTATAWAANSDKRIKTDIQDITKAIETIKKLRPVKFKYTDEYMKSHPSIKNQYYYNYIAQEYQQVFPESVKGSGEYLASDNSSEILQLDSYNSQIVAIRAIQEQQSQIESQLIRIELLEKELCSQNNRYSWC